MRCLKFLLLLLIGISGAAAAQRYIPVDSVAVEASQHILADDYGSIFLYRRSDFSLTKFDSVGKFTGRLMLTVPFRVKDIQNPLRIVLFSENAQQVLFADQNLNEVERISLSDKFAYIRDISVEDQQTVWLLSESSRELLQYNPQNSKVLARYPLNFSFDRISDFLVFDGKLYYADDELFYVRTLSGDLLFSEAVPNVIRLRRENEAVTLITPTSVLKYDEKSALKKVYSVPTSQIVDKNSGAYFERSGGKLYLYPLQK